MTSFDPNTDLLERLTPMDPNEPTSEDFRTTLARAAEAEKAIYESAISEALRRNGEKLGKLLWSVIGLIVMATVGYARLDNTLSNMNEYGTQYSRTWIQEHNDRQGIHEAEDSRKFDYLERRESRREIMLARICDKLGIPIPPEVQP